MASLFLFYWTKEFTFQACSLQNDNLPSKKKGLGGVEAPRKPQQLLPEAERWLSERRSGPPAQGTTGPGLVSPCVSGSLASSRLPQNLHSGNAS